MSALSEKINTIMLQALFKNAKKYRCPVSALSCKMSLNVNGELEVFVCPPNIKPIPVTLSELIGMMYAMGSKGRIKRMLRELEKQHNAKRGSIYVMIGTSDQQTSEIKVFKDGHLQSTLCMTDVLN